MKPPSSGDLLAGELDKVQALAQKGTPPLPTGPYSVIVADPPWQYYKNPGANGPGAGQGGIPENIYPTMSADMIRDLPVNTITAPDAHLFMWVTNPKMFGGDLLPRVSPHDIIKAWGFEYKTIITWVKVTKNGVIIPNGLGHYFRGATEHVLYAKRGRAIIPKEHRLPNAFMAPRGKHSQKPLTFFDIVEHATQGTAGKRLEMFAREPRAGWDVWGNEVC